MWHAHLQVTRQTSEKYVGAQIGNAESMSGAQVLIVWFGEFPEVPKGFAQQAFSIAMAITGLAAFAIVLALVEQLVLQILTENVSRGSQVYEEGHILVLAWADTQRDREVIWKILSQACHIPLIHGSSHRLCLAGSLKCMSCEACNVADQCRVHARTLHGRCHFRYPVADEAVSDA